MRFGTWLVAVSAVLLSEASLYAQTPDAFNPDASGTVFATVCQPDGRVLIAGGFGTLGGGAHSYVGRVNADGTLDTAFDPQANNTVYAVVVQGDGKLLVGGGFTSLGGHPRSGIGRLQNPEPAPRTWS